MGTSYPLGQMTELSYPNRDADYAVDSGAGQCFPVDQGVKVIEDCEKLGGIHWFQISFIIHFISCFSRSQPHR